MRLCNSINFVALISLLAITTCLGAEYKLKDKNNSTCIILDAELSFSFPYETKDSKSEVANWKVGEAAETNGSCSSSSAQLELSFEQPVAARLTLKFANSNSRASLTGAKLLVTVRNGTVFVNPSVNGSSSSDAEFSTQLSPDSEYYECSSVELRLRNNATVVASDVRLQAFGIVNGSMSDTGSVCDGDASSSASPANDTTTGTTPATTQPPTSTPAPPEPTAPLLNFSVRSDAGVCLLASLRATFLIDYATKQNKTKTAAVVLPSGAAANGSCGNSTDELRLKFYGGWSALMRFDGSVGGDYRLSSLSLSYKLDAARFPDAADAGKSRVAASNATFLRVSGNSYYSCASKLSFDLASGVRVETSDLLVQAFRSGNDTEFRGNRVQCDADLPHDNIVPIVVGSALAALVLVVLVAYIIGRRRSAASGYQSV